MLEIRTAYDCIDTVRDLFDEYTAGIGMNLDFQNYDEELATLPGKYAPPDGRLFIAFFDGAPAGCAALRRHDERCEMKRLFVKPGHRGKGIGEALIRLILAEAKTIGYGTIILDTRKSMASSLALYRRLGFREIPAYYHNPYPDTVYLEMPLL